MANVKEVRVEGWMPFTVYENPTALKELGLLNAPSWGLRIRYGRPLMVPNEHGGRTAYYQFEILGQEAVRVEGIEHMIAAFLLAGAFVNSSYWADVENGGNAVPFVVSNSRMVGTALRDALRVAA